MEARSKQRHKSIEFQMIKIRLKGPACHPGCLNLAARFVEIPDP